MRRVLPLILTLSIALLVLPTLAFADAAVVQDSCVWVSPTNVRIYFTVVNFSLPAPICDLHFIPEPQPPLPECTMLGIGQPIGWSGFLNPFGGADWFANTPVDCIPQQTAKGNYWFEVDPGWCCYVVQFTDPTGAVMLEQEECFTLCGKVPIEERSWGRVKKLYE